jgi:glycosyltransferase involved in cell wall biosynthesis
VCLASYNGEKFIREQIKSILPQLGQNDELIVCDDCSTDATCDVVQSFNDPRIKLIRNDKNIGHVKNFEKALSIAKGDFVFLSDQDDVWVQGKVRKVIDAFRKYPDISLVYHNMRPVDTVGNDLHRKFPEYPEGLKNSFIFVIRQLIKPQIFGCACCLRRNRMDSLLPFPNAVYAHDHWIAVWAGINGRVFFLHDALVLYRLHEFNLTPKQRLPLKKSLSFRYKIIMQAFTAIYRKATSKYR